MTNKQQQNNGRAIFEDWLKSLQTLKTTNKEIVVYGKGKKGYTHKVIGLVQIEGEFPSLDLVTMDIESGKLWQFDTGEFGTLNLETGRIPSKSGYSIEIKFPAPKKSTPRAKAEEKKAPNPKTQAALKAAEEKRKAEKVAAEKAQVTVNV